MKYKNMENYGDAKFRWVVGMRRKTLTRTIEILNAKYAEKDVKNERKSGRKPKLSMEGKLAATMEYLREYGSLGRVRASYDIRETYGE